MKTLQESILDRNYEVSDFDILASQIRWISKRKTESGFSGTASRTMQGTDAFDAFVTSLVPDSTQIRGLSEFINLANNHEYLLAINHKVKLLYAIHRDNAYNMVTMQDMPDINMFAILIYDKDPRVMPSCVDPESRFNHEGKPKYYIITKEVFDDLISALR